MKKLRTVSIILMILGFLLILSGPLARIQHWPDMTKGLYPGLIIMVIGVIIFIAGLKKNITS